MEADTQPPIKVRNAAEGDFTSITKLIKENAEYLDIKAPIYLSTDQLIKDCLHTEPPKFYCLICESEDELVGYTTYSHAYSTWVGRSMDIQDFYIKANHRVELFDTFAKALVQRAQDLGCRRIGWRTAKTAGEYNDFWKNLGSIDITIDENWHQYRLNSSDFQSFIDKCS
ncbi:thialysine N-epsilon-acetyltransferase-like [Watersipora subatra]|uniref:thialysine N-epsilon-acetyltransferase-like n=1 Tax=Watersipora subatra TaxID=2589382 RepID=UPI00355B6535